MGEQPLMGITSGWAGICGTEETTIRNVYLSSFRLTLIHSAVGRTGPGLRDLRQVHAALGQR